MAPATGYRRFDITFEQPVDHGDPDGARFAQGLTLMHRDAQAPMVLASTGYDNYLGGRLSEPAQIVAGNQIVVEHRFFGQSRPQPVDWAYLDIEQAAADHHRIAQAFASLYPAGWVSTGASKGGMTAIFHRRFYPDDVDATVAYVAPISFGVDDPRYHVFFDQLDVGSDCPERVRAFQREVLNNAEAVTAVLAQRVEGRTFDRIGGLERAVETAVVEFEWTFWQYLGLDACSTIPALPAEPATLADFLNLSGLVWVTSDAEAAALEPYYYQSFTELGYPSVPVDHLQDLLVFDYATDLLRFMPAGEIPTYDPAPMQDVADWFAGESERIVLVYGALDPWTAGALEIGAGADARDVHLMVAPSENHGANIASLDPADGEQVMDELRSWLEPFGPLPARMHAPALDLPRSLSDRVERMREQRLLRPTSRL